MNRKSKKQRPPFKTQQQATIEAQKIIDRMARDLVRDYLSGVRYYGAAPGIWTIKLPKVDGLSHWEKVRFDALLAARAIEMLKQRGFQPMTIVDSDI